MRPGSACGGRPGVAGAPAALLFAAAMLGAGRPLLAALPSGRGRGLELPVAFPGFTGVIEFLLRKHCGEIVPCLSRKTKIEV